MSAPPLRIMSIFQFTPPRGGRRIILAALAKVGLYFNSRPRVGGDVPRFVQKVKGLEFQFTPPRGGRPLLPAGDQGTQTISIHAPAWGAT